MDSSGINFKSFISAANSEDATQPFIFVEEKTIPSLYMTWIEELAGTSFVTVARYINSSWNYIALINKNNQALSSPHGVYHSFDSSPYVTWSELDNVSVSQIRVAKAILWSVPAPTLGHKSSLDRKSVV